MVISILMQRRLGVSIEGYRINVLFVVNNLETVVHMEIDTIVEDNVGRVCLMIG